MRKSKNVRRSRRMRRKLGFQPMEARRLLAGDGFTDASSGESPATAEMRAVPQLHNEARPTDVNDSGDTSAVDALLVINHLLIQNFDFGLDAANEQDLYLDVNNDGIVTPLDALHIINFLVFGDGQADEPVDFDNPESDREQTADEMDEGDEDEPDEELDEVNDEADDERDEEIEDDEEPGEELDEEHDEELIDEDMDEDLDENEDDEEFEDIVGEEEEEPIEDDPSDHVECDGDLLDEPDETPDTDPDSDSEPDTDSEPDVDTDTDSDSDQIPNPDTNTDSLNLQIDDSQIGTTEGFEIRTDGIFALWWDPMAGPIDPGAEVVFDLLAEVRNDVTTNLGFGDPPNAAAGYYFNVFVHRGEDDRFPNFFGNGVGFEAPTEFPDLAIPEGLHDDRSNVLHEAFHVFQTSSNYEVVDTNPDAPWIVEASAEWYQASRNPTDPRSFIVAGSPYALPHLSWWYTPGREPDGVVNDNGWLYGVREYAMSSFLYYLTNVESVDPAVIGGVYATNSDLTAQEFIFNAVGGDQLREMFADWAVRTAAGLDYLTLEQVEIALNELNAEATSGEIKNNIVELTDGEANGSFRPEQALTPGGWAYNSIKINNSRDTSYTFEVLGDATGSQGATSHFEARIAVVNGQSITYHDLPMADNLTGQFVLNTTSADSEIYLVIASTPDHLEGTQTYDYQVNISTDSV